MAFGSFTWRLQEPSGSTEADGSRKDRALRSPPRARFAAADSDFGFARICRSGCERSGWIKRAPGRPMRGAAFFRESLSSSWRPLLISRGLALAPRHEKTPRRFLVCEPQGSRGVGVCSLPGHGAGSYLSAPGASFIVRFAESVNQILWVRPGLAQHLEV
jgi:hypothetical protein